MLEKIEWAIKNGQSIKTGNTGYRTHDEDPPPKKTPNKMSNRKMLDITKTYSKTQKDMSPLTNN